MVRFSLPNDFTRWESCLGQDKRLSKLSSCHVALHYSTSFEKMKRSPSWPLHLVRTYIHMYMYILPTDALVQLEHLVEMLARYVHSYQMKLSRENLSSFHGHRGNREISTLSTGFTLMWVWALGQRSLIWTQALTRPHSPNQFGLEKSLVEPCCKDSKDYSLIRWHIWVEMCTKLLWKLAHILNQPTVAYPQG